MLNKSAIQGVVRAAGIVCFFAGVFFLAQAYTMAFMGSYLDCFHGCSLRSYGEPTLDSMLYGPLLAAAVFYVGQLAFRWQRY
jgi:uncharacterized protein (DUF2062 family)